MSLRKDFERIRDDGTSGSTKIALETCELIRKGLSSGISREDLEKMLLEIRSAHRPMAILHSCVEHFLRGGEPEEFIKALERKTAEAGERACEFLKERGIERLITISSSSAVESALSSFDGSIYVMESRPMLEGTMMAERLAAKGRDVTVVTDAYGISMAARGKVDAVIVGADALHRNMIINKVGTYALSVAAEKSGIEFIVVLTTDKIFPEDVELSDKEIMQFHDPKEISKNIKAENPYFEATPIRKGMKVFSEKGVMGVRK